MRMKRRLALLLLCAGCTQPAALPFRAILAYDESAPAQGSVVLTVHAYPDGNGPENLVSNAAPFKPGVLTDSAALRLLDGTSEVAVAARVLARWPRDNSIRSILLQFEAPFEGESKAFTLEIGVRRTLERPFTEVNWDLPKRIFTLSPDYLCDSLIFWEQKPLGHTGFPEWDKKQVATYSKIEVIGTAPCVRDDNYYDATTTTYQLYARTGELKYLVNARKWALHHRRDQIYLDGATIGHPKCASGYVNNTRYTFPQGLISDYFMFGDEEAKRVSGIVVDNFYMPHAGTFYYKAPNTRGWWTEREPAFSLIGILAHYEATGNTVYLDKVKERVASLHKMQVDNGRRAWVHNLHDHDTTEGCAETDWGSSPWMSGLLLEPIIEYHKLTGDPLARESILMAVDDLRKHYVATGSHAGASFVYLGCPKYVDGAPDLDNLISHAYGYAYKLTGNPEYLKLGTAIFNTSVESGVTASHKHYDQQFRSSGRFVAYVWTGPPALHSVVGAATFMPDLACSPNALATIFGSNFTAGGAEGASTIPLPGQLQGVSVKADGIELPLLYVSPNQINFQCPDRVSGQHLWLTVETGGQACAPVDIVEQFATPGIFTLNSSGAGQGTIVIANTDQIAMPATPGISSRPAVPGDYISIFATGLGPVREPVLPGAASPAGDGSRVIAPVRVLIGDRISQVMYAGLAPGWVGLYQVNARIPDAVPFADDVPVVIEVSDLSGNVRVSNRVTISVQPAQ